MPPNYCFSEFIQNLTLYRLLPIKLEFRETEFKEDITFFDDDNHVYFYNNKTWVSGRLPAFSMALGLRSAEFLSSLYLSRRVDDAQSRLHGMFVSSIRFLSSFFVDKGAVN